MFKTQFDKHERIFQNSGSPVKVTYAPQYDKNGVLDLVVSGQENLYDYIQSFAESCDIHVLLDRYRDGDASVLSRVQGFSLRPEDMLLIFQATWQSLSVTISWHVFSIHTPHYTFGYV